MTPFPFPWGFDYLSDVNCINTVQPCFTVIGVTLRVLLHGGTLVLGPGVGGAPSMFLLASAASLLVTLHDATIFGDVDGSLPTVFLNDTTNILDFTLFDDSQLRNTIRPTGNLVPAQTTVTLVDSARQFLSFPGFAPTYKSVAAGVSGVYAGSAQLSGGQVTVQTPSITTTSQITATYNSATGLSSGFGFLVVTNRDAGLGRFTIGAYNSSGALLTGSHATIFWHVIDTGHNSYP